MRVSEIAAWKRAEQARREAKRCRDQSCRQLPPDHLVGCDLVRPPVRPPASARPVTAGLRLSTSAAARREELTAAAVRQLALAWKRGPADIAGWLAYAGVILASAETYADAVAADAVDRYAESTRRARSGAVSSRG